MAKGPKVSLGSAGSIVIEYDADTLGFDKGTAHVERSTKSVSKQLIANGAAFAKWAAGATIAATAVGIAMFNSQSKTMDQLRRTSDAMGEQQERLQALIHIAGLADTSAEQLATSLDYLQRIIGDIKTESDPAAIALAKIGMSVEGIRALSPIQQFEAIARGINELGTAAERSSVRTALLGRASKEMTDFLRELGQQGIDPTIAKLDEMGILLTRGQTQLVDNAGDAIFEAKAVLSGVAQQAVAAMAPFVQVLAEAFVDSVDDVDNWGARVTAVLDTVAVSGIMVASRLRGPMDVLKGALQDLWNGYTSLPAWAQEVGVVGAILGGKQGAALVTAISFTADKTRELTALLASFSTTEAGAQESLRDYLGRVFDKFEGIRNMGAGEQAPGPSIIQMLFGEPGEDADTWATEAIAAYRTAIEQVRVQAAAGAKAAEDAAVAPTGEAAPSFRFSPEENEAFLERMRERFMSESELENARYEEERARLFELLQQKTDYWEDYYTVQDQLAAEHAEKMKAIAEADRAARISIYSNMMTNLSSLMNTGSRKLFNIGKVAAIANALIKGREAVVSSYAAGAKIGGPWLGAAYAATAAVATAAQIAQIRATSFDSGGSPSAGGGGFSGGVPVQNTQPGSGLGPVQPSRQTSITLVGASFTAQQVRDLIGQINEQLGDGMQLVAN